MWCKKKWLNLLFIKPKELEDDLQDKTSDIKYTEKTSIEGFFCGEITNNSTLIKPKELDKDSEDKSYDKNKNKRLRVIYKTRKGLRQKKIDKRNIQEKLMMMMKMMMRGRGGGGGGGK